MQKENKKDVLAFSDFNEDLRFSYGNKAANLARLFQLGFNVPNGFVITSDFFKKIDKNNNNESTLFNAIKSLNLPVVVRSSGISEDSKEKSYAGIYKTIININSWEDCFFAIEAVYKSTNTEIAKSYNLENNLNMSVIVQEMINPEHAGVVFTVNPIVNDNSEMIIEYFNGLGSAVVNGETTPQHLVIDKNKKIIKDFIKSSEGLASYPSVLGGCEKINLSGKKVTLIKKDILEKIIEVSLKIENVMNVPQDIEWAVFKNKVYILQARPITAISNGG